jgi:magnesium chelatase subunit D
MNDVPTRLTDRTDDLLACAVLHPRLWSMLLYDADMETLLLASYRIQNLLREYTGRKVAFARLPAHADESYLWRPAPRLDDRNLPPLWGPGLLTPHWLRQNAGKDGILVLLVPDLTRLGVIAKRAGVMLANAEIAHLQRTGQDETWEPRIFWLAGCTSARKQYASRHLRDRFVVQVYTREGGQWLSFDERVARLREMIETGADSPEARFRAALHAADLSAGDQANLARARTRQAVVTEAAQDQIMGYGVEMERVREISARGEIALGRLAASYARLYEPADGALVEVQPAHVDAVAGLLGLSPLVTKKTDDDEVAGPDLIDKTRTAEVKTAASETKVAVSSISNPVHRGETDLKAEPVPVSPPKDEDTSPERRPEQKPVVAPVQASLKLPWQPQGRGVSAGRGAAVGVRRAREPHDIALVPTLMETLKFNRMRREHFKQRAKRSRLIFMPSDLRQYRRAPVPAYLLVLVVDYTSLKGRAWLDPLAYYLRRAYAKRAETTLIKVGAAYPDPEADPVVQLQDALCAESVTAHSVMVPRILRSFRQQAGLATPLAHGLYLAHDTLAGALKDGLTPIEEATLVVLTDGRGNVPLKNSLTRVLPERIDRQGIEDAYKIARQISEMDRVEKVVLDPQPGFHSRLPGDLAQALGARKIVPIPAVQAKGAPPMRRPAAQDAGVDR